MSFQGSVSVRRPLAAAAAVVILLAGSTMAFAKDKGDGGGGRGGGGGGRNAGSPPAVARESRQQPRAPQQRAPQADKAPRVREAPAAPRMNRQEKQASNQAEQIARSQQRTLNQQNKQAVEAARLQEKLAQQGLRDQKQAFLQDQRDQNRGLKQAETEQRRLERAEVKNLNQLEQQQKQDARDLQRDTRRATDATRRQNIIDKNLTEQALAGGRNPRNPEKFNPDRGVRADNGVNLTGQQARRNRNVINGDNNTVIRNRTKIVNKYYGDGVYGWNRHHRDWYDDRCDWRPRHRWNDCDNDGWNISFGFSSWGHSSFGFSYHWYDYDSCWRPCRTSWCAPRWYYRDYCWPTFVSYCPPPRVYYVYPSYTCSPTYSYTTGSDFGYYGTTGVSTYTTTADYDATDSAANPFDDSAADDFSAAMNAPDYDYSDDYTPSSSPTAEMTRGSDYSSQSGDISGTVKPDRPFDNQPASESLNTTIAWQLLEDARYQEALTRFSSLAQSDAGDAAPKVGYAIAAAMLSRDDTAAWAMRRAFVANPESVGFIPESQNLRRDLDKLSLRLKNDIQTQAVGGMVNISDRWFLLAAVEYLRRDMSSAKSALEQSVKTDQTRDSTANFQRLLDRGS